MFKLSRYTDTGATSVGVQRSRSRNVDTADTPTQQGTGFAKPVGLGILEGLVPENQGVAMRKIYRDMYKHDPIIGAVIDMLSNLPFGQFSLSGLPDRKMLQTHLTTCERIRVQSLLPALTVDYFVNGAFLGVLNYDPSDKVFDSVAPQNLDYAEIQHVPIFGNTPLVSLKFPPEWKALLSKAADPRVAKVLKWVPQRLQEAIKAGKLDLNTENTLFVPRRTFSYDMEGSSILARLVPLFIMEKALLRGTIELSYRRQRAILHIMVGDEEWTPNQTDLDAVAALFTQADRDPVGPVVATRPGILVQEIQSGGEFWRHDSMSDQFTSLKLKSLGVGETFLGTDASVQGAESAMNVFMKQLMAYRQLITQEVFYGKIFPMVSATNGFEKDDDQVDLGRVHRDDASGKWFALADGQGGKVREEDIDASKYHIPTVTWHTSLSAAQSGPEYIELLKTLTQAGVPVPIRLMAAAGGLNLVDIIHGKDEDLELRRQLAEYGKAVKKYMPKQEGEDLGSADFASAFIGTPRRSILDRDFGDLNDRLTPNLDGRGKRQVKTKQGQDLMDDTINKRIAEAAVRLHGG